MRKITIGGIIMPETRSLEIGGEYLSKETTMASGKIVRDIIGWRKILTASWEYVPAGTLASLVALTRSGKFVNIEYPDSTGEDVAGMFSIEIGKQKIFKFRGSSPYWYNVELTATAQEVE